MLVGFSCDATCLSWIELIFDIGMWTSLLIYLFEVIKYGMEAIMIVILEDIDGYSWIDHGIMYGLIWCKWLNMEMKYFDHCFWALLGIELEVCITWCSDRNRDNDT